MKRQLTVEQEAARDERRARFKDLCKRVAAMSDVERAELTNRVGAIMTCEGRTLSLHNTLTVLLQNPRASVVGGFRQWLAAGRCVRKGEHGAMIWVPCGVRQGTEGEPANATAAEDEAGNDRRFIMGTVFDVSQTEERVAEKGEVAA
jgi:antirestriction protein ArdC